MCISGLLPSSSDSSDTPLRSPFSSRATEIEPPGSLLPIPLPSKGGRVFFEAS